jgi:isoquinoline 1-oxidoreductase subunit beta
MSEKSLSRRFFIKSGLAAGGGLFLAGSFDFAARPAAQSVETALNAWIRIAPDNRITLVCSQSEMGQGIMTTLPAVLAEELGADWKNVQIEFSPVAPAYQNPRIKWMFTGNSESTMSFFELLRTIGAAAREMLVTAAARRLNVPAAELRAENSKIVHAGSRRALTFGELAPDAAKLTPPENPKLKAEREWKLLGKSLPRIETASKLDGSAVFGIDFTMPGMVHAAVRQSPVHGPATAAFDKTEVLKMPGVIDVVPIPNGVAVVAEKYYEAQKALDRLKVSFSNETMSAVSTASLRAQYRAALDGEKWKTVEGAEEADEKTLKTEPAGFFSQEYESQFLAHATMEPMNCTAKVTGDRCEIFAPTQGSQLTQLTLAGVLELPPEKIFVNRTLLGGGFGRRLWTDFAVQAALISKAVGRPVKVIWTREEDMRHDIYRPATLHRIAARLDAAGKPSEIAHKLVSPSILQYIFAPGVTDDLDPSCLEGLVEEAPDKYLNSVPEPLYDFPKKRVDFHLLKTSVPTSVLRTTGFGPNIFALESFIDELAARVRRDPYEFRRAFLKNERLRAVLELAAEKANWRRKPAKNVFRGIACTEAFKTHIAHVVELSVVGSEVKIHRVVCAIDAGTVLDPEITKNSLEGGSVWGIGCAFTAEINFAAGRTVEGNFSDYKLPRIEHTPPIEVYWINSGARPLGGTGEVGPVTVVPAIANAIFAATGNRYRSLPLSKHGLKLS